MSPFYISSHRTAMCRVSAKNPLERCSPGIFLLISKETSPRKTLQSFFCVVIIIYIIILITEIKKVDKVHYQLRILCFVVRKMYFLPGKGAVISILAFTEGQTGISMTTQCA